jgi:hypothetical protein
MNEAIELLNTFAKSYGLAFTIMGVMLVAIWREWRKNESERWEILRELTDLVKKAVDK